MCMQCAQSVNHKQLLCDFNHYDLFIVNALSYILKAVTKMVQEAFTYVDSITNMETKLKLIDTLRTVTSGKVNKNFFVFKMELL